MVLATDRPLHQLDTHQLDSYYQTSQTSQTPRKVYAFPPVPLIPLTLQKIREDRCLGILVVPQWHNAKWWDMLTELLVEEPVALGYYKGLVTTSHQQKIPYLGTLVACLVGQR